MATSATGNGQSAIGPAVRKPTVDEVFNAVVAATAQPHSWSRIDRRFMMVTSIRRGSRRAVAARRVVIRLLRDLRGMSVAEASLELGYASGSGPHNLDRSPDPWEAIVERDARRALDQAVAA